MAGRGTGIFSWVAMLSSKRRQECVKKGFAQPVREAQGQVITAVDDEKDFLFYYRAANM